MTQWSMVVGVLSVATASPRSILQVDGTWSTVNGGCCIAEDSGCWMVDGGHRGWECVRGREKATAEEIHLLGYTGRSSGQGRERARERGWRGWRMRGKKFGTFTLGAKVIGERRKKSLLAGMYSVQCTVYSVYQSTLSVHFTRYSLSVHSVHVSMCLCVRVFVSSCIHVSVCLCVHLPDNSSLRLQAQLATSSKSLLPQQQLHFLSEPSHTSPSSLSCILNPLSSCIPFNHLPSRKLPTSFISFQPNVKCSSDALYIGDKDALPSPSLDRAIARERKWG